MVSSRELPEGAPLLALGANPATGPHRLVAEAAHPDGAVEFVHERA